ncbi:ribonuclease III [Corynespora cassiicola Philippines]|uniref:Ribonuclease III n=1 Tax=Corynespora cassiicola Philippines TaxID=1448308 RepID=A0A2T2NLX4_CORCC|nr:ribonuclease III [Corynespora cassiicola Philippines]
MNFDDVKVTEADQRLGGIFKDKRICAEALQMRGPVSLMVVSGAYQKIESNKRLSILGDAVLTNSLCNIWYASQDNKGRPQPPHVWTTIRDKLLGNDSLARRGKIIGIQDCIIMSDGTPVPSDSMIAITLKALVGGVYRDGGQEAVDKVISTLGLDKHDALMPDSH